MHARCVLVGFIVTLIGPSAVVCCGHGTQKCGTGKRLLPCVRCSAGTAQKRALLVHQYKSLRKVYLSRARAAQLLPGLQLVSDAASSSAAFRLHTAARLLCREQVLRQKGEAGEQTRSTPVTCVVPAHVLLMCAVSTPSHSSTDATQAVHRHSLISRPDCVISVPVIKPLQLNVASLPCYMSITCKAQDS
jgi:hypothetical protein